LAAITYQEIFKESQVANRLIGMSHAEFEKLYAEFELAHIKRWGTSPYTQRHKVPRKRTAGAGRKYKYALRDRLLMTLFWLRAYTTYEVLGSFYHLNKTTVEDNIKDVLETLATMKAFRFELPQPEVPKLRSVQEVLDAFPDLRLVLDAKEQQ
jgi:hypothetical protein